MPTEISLSDCCCCRNQIYLDCAQRRSDYSKHKRQRRAAAVSETGRVEIKLLCILRGFILWKNPPHRLVEYDQRGIKKGTINSEGW